MKIQKLLLISTTIISCSLFCINSFAATTIENVNEDKSINNATDATNANTQSDISDPKKVTVEITNAWARSSIAPNNNSAAYMVINNNTDKEYILIGASSIAVANNVELHKSFVDEKGVSRMSSIDKIVIPANSTVTMEPGGLHVMLLDLKRNLIVGDKINIEIQFENTTPLTVEVEVK